MSTFANYANFGSCHGLESLLPYALRHLTYSERILPLCNGSITTSVYIYYS
jgi:hypothetical protein